jgi:hypothetical protein
MKLSRKAVKEGLQAVPVDVLLLGAAAAKETKLTAKQRKFAERIALGDTKAGAYRAAYDSKGNGYTQSRRGQELAKHSAIQAQIEALKLAGEAARHATPAALRSLVIQQLTEHALSQDVPPAQRLRALELLGKVTEIAAFTERREIVQAIDAAGARAALLESLRDALRQTSIDAEIVSRPGSDRKPALIDRADGNSVTDAVMAADPGRGDEGASGDPTGAAPPARPGPSAPAMLSNPNIGSPIQSAGAPLQPTLQPVESAPESSVVSSTGKP